MNGKVRVWDFVLIAALLAASLAVLLIPKKAGAEAVVAVNGTTRAVLPLSEDTVFSLDDGTRVVVEGGTVRVEHSSCPDHLCESMGPVSSAGAVILCLPNRISVRVSSGEVDAVVG